MRVEAFHYELPPELIAQRPAERRELARLMHVPGEGAPEHRGMAELPDLLPEGALVVVNDTRVIPARLLGRKVESGGRVEVFLLRNVGSREVETRPGELRSVAVWEALGKSSKPFRVGADIEVLPRAGVTAAGLVVRILRVDGRSPAPPERGRNLDTGGVLEVGLFTPDGGPLADALRACGHVPLPPYIRREDDGADADRYQTVYARHDGAVAAPTAGLHLTDALLERLAARGCELASITLHVGLGTFQPVVVDDLSDHPMHSESYTVPPATADAVARARSRRNPVVAIGTTTVRALESAADPATPGLVRPGSGDTRLLIQPGYPWRVVDGLLTNFHLPRSTLLALVCAFAGTDRVLGAYRAAVEERYRFYSYGDGMLLWRGP